MVHKAGIAPYGSTAFFISELIQAAAVFAVGVVQVPKPEGMAVFVAECADTCEYLFMRTVVEIVSKFGRDGVGVDLGTVQVEP